MFEFPLRYGASQMKSPNMPIFINLAILALFYCFSVAGCSHRHEPIPVESIILANKDHSNSSLETQLWAKKSFALINKGYLLAATNRLHRDAPAAYADQRNAVCSILQELWIETGNAAIFTDNDPEDLVREFERILGHYSNYVTTNQYRPYGDMVIEKLAITIDQLNSPYADGAFHSFSRFLGFGIGFGLPDASHDYTLCDFDILRSIIPGANYTASRNQLIARQWYVVNNHRLAWSISKSVVTDNHGNYFEIDIRNPLIRQDW